MSTSLSRLRRKMPYLTPPFVEEEIPLIRRPLIPAPRDVAMSLPPLTRTPPQSVEPMLPPLRRELSAPLPSWNTDEVSVRDSEPEYLPPITRNPVPVEYAPPPALASFNLPPVMIGGRDGRPERVVAEGSDLDRAILKRRAVEDYQPKKESKKHLLARTLLNFVGGGIPGAAQTLIGPGGIMDRRGLDRDWQENELARTDQTIGNLRLDRRAGMQDDLLQSQIAENQAQAARALREPSPNQKYDWLDDPANPDSQVYSPLTPGTVRRRAEKMPPLTDRTIGNTILRRQPDGSYTPVYTAPDKPDKADTASFTNTNLEQNISEAQGEKKKIAEALANTAEFIETPSPYSDGVPTKHPNPIHQSLKSRERELDDQIRRWRADMKPPPLTRSASPRGGKYKGQRIARSKLPEAAKRLKMSEAQAEAYITREGGAIY